MELTIQEFQEGIAQGVIRGLICEKCGHKHVGPLTFCGNCGSSSLKKAEFAQTGRIVTYTIQWVAPEPFFNDAPYAWIVVELDDGARATGWIPFASKPEELEVGQRVKFVKSYKPGIVFERIQE